MRLVSTSFRPRSRTELVTITITLLPLLLCRDNLNVHSQDEINSRIDLVLRMADEKWRLAQHAYDSLDINIRRLDSDLGRMEVRAIKCHS